VQVRPAAHFAGELRLKAAERTELVRALADVVPPVSVDVLWDRHSPAMPRCAWAAIAFNVIDNCTLVRNTLQLDIDGDGYGNAYDADITNGGIVNFADLAQLKRAFFTDDPIADLNAEVGFSVRAFDDIVLHSGNLPAGSLVDVLFTLTLASDVGEHGDAELGAGGVIAMLRFNSEGGPSPSLEIQDTDSGSLALRTVSQIVALQTGQSYRLQHSLSVFGGGDASFNFVGSPSPREPGGWISPRTTPRMPSWMWIGEVPSCSLKRSANAGHEARSGGTRYIFASPGLMACRRRPLSSNVRLHKTHRTPASWPSVPYLCRLLCKEIHMATNLAIDPDLLDRALEVSGERTKRATVTKALEEFIARRQQRRVLELMGKLEWDTSFNYKAERSRK